MEKIQINGAREANLKNISVEIPRGQLVVFTGLSGSGKSSLLVDVLMVECQRQYLEAMGMQGIRKPDVDSVKNASPAVLISQTDANKNPRSTVGTLTDIYTDLRMIYEKLSVRICPKCGKQIASSRCKEETEKIGDDFNVYMYCCNCNHKMNKLTRTDFSFNTREGACKTCEGLGNVISVDRSTAVKEALSLEEGAVPFWEAKYKEYQIQNLYAAFSYYGISILENTAVEKYSGIQKAILYDGVSADIVLKTFPNIAVPKTVSDGKFEGVVPGLMRRMAQKGGDAGKWKSYFNSIVCPDCKGERLGKLSRAATVQEKRLPEIAVFSLEEIRDWAKKIEDTLTQEEKNLVEDYLKDILIKVNRITNVGLGYLTPDRQIITLSGGELQRIRLAAALDCDLTGIIYVMDEPTTGLHPKDTVGMIKILKKLRDRGNSVLVIEHDEDVMNEADYVIDMGPGAGHYGGCVVGEGTLEELKKQKASVTGRYLSEEHPVKIQRRKGNGSYIPIKDASLFNLKNVSVDIPGGCMTAVTGVSGSGKSTLIFEVLAKELEKKNDMFDKIITVEQTAINRMKRSNAATYSDVYTHIRKLFSETEAAKKAGMSANYFSFNTKGGRCENCEGMGYIVSNLLFFEDIEVQCPVCKGKRFNEEVLSILYKGYSVNDILKMSVEEALRIFCDKKTITKILELLKDVGLEYIELGQTLTTLSGGEGQRLKLAKELLNSSGKNSLYLLDEPTRGLHPKDVEHFLVLLNRITDAGNTVIVVEHNEQLIENCDWMIELGPEGGKKGGEIIYAGVPLIK